MKKFTSFFLLIFLIRFFSFAQQGTWTFMKGDSAFLSPGHYGTKGVPAAANTPPAMYSPTRWKDLDGNFWFYGGYGPEEFLGDLWKYDPVQNMWTWIKGNGAVNQPAVYGTQGVPSPTNFPGCRGWSCASWVDVHGDLWIFGGRGFGNDPTKATMLSDLWRYHIATNEWTWMKGNGDDSTRYGIKLVPDENNTPGVRQEVTANWTDDAGGLWTYGGITNGVLKSDRNDMWRYDINTNEWTWMSGDTTFNVLPNAAAPGVFSPSNTPGGRMSYCSWQDKDGLFWFFGGHNDFYGPDWSDLWQYDPSINQWAFISGSFSNTDGNAGNLCDTSGAFYPKGRWENRVRWIDACGNLWLFGGQRNSGSLNDLWMYSPKYKVWSFVGGKLVTNNTGKYGVKGVADPSNLPGSRTGAGSWIDNQGNFWLFAGAQTTSHATLRNDLWKYVPDPDCPAIHCNKLSEPADDIADIDLSGFNNSWIHGIHKEDMAGDAEESSVVSEEALHIYPNPNSGNFIVEWRGNTAGQLINLMVCNSLGQSVYSYVVNVPSSTLKKEIDLSKQPPGMYFLELSVWSSSQKSGTAFWRRKILIE